MDGEKDRFWPARELTLKTGQGLDHPAQNRDITINGTSVRPKASVELDLIRAKIRQNWVKGRPQCFFAIDRFLPSAKIHRSLRQIEAKLTRGVIACCRTVMNFIYGPVSFDT